jgi:hypothetical protein
MKEAVTRWFLQRRPLTLEETQSQWVELGFARFLSVGSPPVIDEPLVMMAAAKQLLDQGWFKRISREALDAEQPTVAGFKYEIFLAVYLLGVFTDSVSLNDVFEFSNEAPEWAHKKGVKLVASVIRDGEKKWATVSWCGSPQVLPASSLGRPAKSWEDVVAWFEHPSTPLLFPDTLMGPDIIFFVQLASGDIICVVLQAKLYKNGMQPHKVKKAIHATDPQSFYSHQVSQSVSRSQLSYS